MTTDLIKALEAAEGPSRELDEMIAVYMGWIAPGMIYKPIVTGSIDEALKLVPDGRLWLIEQRVYAFWAVITLAGVPLYQQKGFIGTSKTPAIALVIAALKAREAMKENGT